VPEGAIPKDGPSAGITLATALVSALTNRPVRRDVAMTGEITLRGNVLAIGGLKEKVLAAHRAKIATVVIPEANRRHLVEVPKALRRSIRFLMAGHVSEVLAEALLRALTDLDRIRAPSGRREAGANGRSATRGRRSKSSHHDDQLAPYASRRWRQSVT
jgi:ATP-dependent Lon protease